MQETAQVEKFIRNLEKQGKHLILISHNMRQEFDLVDRIVASLLRSEVVPEDVVAYNTRAKTSEEFAEAA